MIVRIKQILDKLNEKKILDKREIIRSFRNKNKTRQALSHIVLNRYAFSFGSYLLRAKNRRTNLEDINPLYVDYDTYVKDRLEPITPNTKNGIGQHISIIEWCYVLHKEEYKQVTAQFLCDISKKDYMYTQRQLTSMSKCGYIDQIDTDIFELKPFIPNFSVSSLEDKEESLNPLKKKKAPKVRKDVYYRKPKKDILSEREMISIASRLTNEMSPTDSSEKAWMMGNFISALEWANNN